MIKILMKEDWIPPFADKPVFVIAPAITVVTTLMSFCGDCLCPGDHRGRPERRRALLPGDVLARRLQPRARRVVVEQQVLPAGRPAGRGPDAQLRAVHRPVADGRRHAGRLLQRDRHRGGPERHVVLRAPDSSAWSCSSSPDWPRRTGCRSTCPEAENELVAGYHSEYSGMKFGMFFLGEYIGITLISALITTFFFGGWLGPWLPGVRLVLHQDDVLHLPVHRLASVAAPAPVRSAHVPRLEADAPAGAAEPAGDGGDSAGSRNRKGTG